MLTVAGQHEALSEAIATADPDRIAGFLLSQGWTRGEPWRGKGFDWITGDNEHVLVPTDPSLPHYISTLSKVFEMFAVEGVSFDDVVTMASSLSSDIFRRHINDPVTKSGSCLLEDARKQYEAMQSLLHWSSKRLAARSKTARRLPGRYLSNCRAGQTEVGSYVLKVYAPIIVPEADEEHRAFGRHATTEAMANVDYLAEEIGTLESPPPLGLDWHVCHAAMQLQSSDDLWSYDSAMSVHYMKNVFATGDASPDKPVKTAPLRKPFFEKATRLYETLRKGELFEKAKIFGVITDLHKDPITNKAPDRRITVRGKIEKTGPERSITMRLTPDDYKKAVLWHNDDAIVEVHAKIDKRWRVWTTVEYYSMTALVPEKNEQTAALL